MKKNIWRFIFVSWIVLFFCPQSEALRISFVGDIMTHEQQLHAAKTNDGYNFLPQFEKIIPYLRADLLVGNFETTLPGASRGYSGYPSFGTPDSLADALSACGFKVLLLANNHIYDKGRNGLIRTIDTLEQTGFLTTGAYKNFGDIEPLLINLDEIDIGILNYSYGSNSPLSEKLQGDTHLNVINESDISADIKNLIGRGAKFIIATFHWGNEYQPKPSAAQRRIAQLCLDSGANAVVGTHPHILQPIEIYEKSGDVKLAAFSLGNFVSSQRTLPRERSVVLTIEIARDEGGKVQIKKVEIAPTYVETGATKNTKSVRVIHASERPNIEKEILKFLNVKSETNDNGFYKIYP